MQHELIRQRVDEGHEIVGVKMGFTSHAKMKQMGVNDMIIGQLTADMQLDGAHHLLHQIAATRVQNLKLPFASVKTSKAILMPKRFWTMWTVLLRPLK